MILTICTDTRGRDDVRFHQNPNRHGADCGRRWRAFACDIWTAYAGF